MGVTGTSFTIVFVPFVPSVSVPVPLTITGHVLGHTQTSMEMKLNATIKISPQY